MIDAVHNMLVSLRGNFSNVIISKRDLIGLKKMCPGARKSGPINPHQQQCHFRHFLTEALNSVYQKNCVYQ